MTETIKNIIKKITQCKGCKESEKFICNYHKKRFEKDIIKYFFDIRTCKRCFKIFTEFENFKEYGCKYDKDKDPRNHESEDMSWAYFQMSLAFMGIVKENMAKYTRDKGMVEFKINKNAIYNFDKEKNIICLKRISGVNKYVDNNKVYKENVKSFLGQ